MLTCGYKSLSISLSHSINKNHFSPKVQHTESDTTLIDVCFGNEHDCLRFHKLKLATIIEMRTFMALPDVDDTDDIDRMMQNDTSNEKFKNIGLRVS